MIDAPPNLLPRAGHLCHEVRKPIAAIAAFAEILVDELSGPLNGDQKDHVRTILANARRLDRHVGSLLEFTQACGGALPLASERCDLAQLCEARAAAVRPAFERAGVSLRIEPQPALIAEGVDSGALGRTLERLLDNALAASEAGSEVTLGLSRRGESGCITVTDRGPGPSPEWTHGAFEAFPTDPPSSVRGLGLGLFLCKAVAEAHGGELRVEHAPHGGTRLTLEFPLNPVPDPIIR